MPSKRPRVVQVAGKLTRINKQQQAEALDCSVSSYTLHQPHSFEFLIRFGPDKVYELDYSIIFGE